ncbi:CCA tRNA nucleotidyltransferase [Labrenzia sp. PHM005]|uniref:CCA tRNA nucleotidyltransferase n=1 Tax=Labrenzia sp. PHM005 TaxID=2590016 RepID=UPI00113FCC52|nr:CCA tRNA nucleotidyltransferase [Labrenzia sp. PHM005]QDG76436.1 CCA tRNA nucleotidyltransferase [Labrenzia sp. PHM005]
MKEKAHQILAAADWLLSKDIQAVFSAIDRDGDSARVVGGAIRNTLLGYSVPDIDIATTATPQDVMRRASNAGLKAIGTGIDHGTITVISNGFPYEVTTLREDVETYGRQARVVFGRDWTKDALRRDFTMNALYVDRHGYLHDPLDGLEDCFARRVRFIGDPDMRIREDYLRILRFFRIYAAYGEGDMDADGLGACLRERDGLRHLSAERIGHEMRRLMAAPKAAIALRMMNDCGLWEIATGGLARIDDYDALRALDGIAAETRDPELGLIVLAGFVREDVDRVADRLRLSNSERRRMMTGWTVYKQFRQADTWPDLKWLLYVHGRQGAIDGLLAYWAAFEGQYRTGSKPDFSKSLQTLRTADIPIFPLKGADVIALGHPPGPGVGQLLKSLEQIWRESGFTLDKKDLMSRVVINV